MVWKWEGTGEDVCDSDVVFLCPCQWCAIGVWHVLTPPLVAGICCPRSCLEFCKGLILLLIAMETFLFCTFVIVFFRLQLYHGQLMSHWLREICFRFQQLTVHYQVRFQHCSTCGPSEFEKGSFQPLWLALCCFPGLIVFSAEDLWFFSTSLWWFLQFSLTFAICLWVVRTCGHVFDVILPTEFF